MDRISCILCGNENGDIIYTLHDYGYGIPGEFPLIRCPICGLIYVSPRPGADEMEDYYPQNYAPYKKAIEDEKWILMRWIRRRNIRKYRRVVEQYVSSGHKKILDVGCSTGIFLAEMRDAGWTVVGTDINAKVIDYTRQRFNLDVIQGQFSEVLQTLSFAAFDAVTMWDVLEHTYNPLETLKQVNMYMEMGGFVFLTFPHYESLDRKLYKRFWIGYDAPRHLFAFTREVISKMLVEAGFTVNTIRCAFGGYYTTIPSLLRVINSSPLAEKARNVLNRLFYIPGLRFIFAPIDALLDIIGLGNKLLVVARKTEAILPDS